jgi:hypothetical protein
LARELVEILQTYTEHFSDFNCTDEVMAHKSIVLLMAVQTAIATAGRRPASACRGGGAAAGRK